jgi:hypothetical protein
MKVKEASQILAINYQTAKSILRRFNKSGVIYRNYTPDLDGNPISGPETLPQMGDPRTTALALKKVAAAKQITNL